MKNPALKKLIRKYLLGKATEDESNALLRYYERQQSYHEWNTELMGDQEESRTRILAKIKKQMQPQSYQPAFPRWAAAATIVVLTSLILIGGYSIRKSHERHKDPYITLTAAGATTKARLADGSIVWLNSGTTIRYPKEFKADVREIEIDGEAYFEVKHKNIPFIVRSGKMITHVLGTSFNVRAYPDDRLSRVTVLSGKVGVTYPGLRKNEAVYLVPNEQLQFDASVNLGKKTVTADASTSIAWRERKVKFRNTPFPEAIEELRRTYKLKISYSADLNNCPVFADFSYDENPANVLRMLSRSLGGKAVQKGDAYLLTGRPCR